MYRHKRDNLNDGKFDAREIEKRNREDKVKKLPIVKSHQIMTVDEAKRIAKNFV